MQHRTGLQQFHNHRVIAGHHPVFEHPRSGGDDPALASVFILEGHGDTLKSPGRSLLPAPFRFPSLRQCFFGVEEGEAVHQLPSLLRQPQLGLQHLHGRELLLAEELQLFAGAHVSQLEIMALAGSALCCFQLRRRHQTHRSGYAEPC